MSLIKEKLKVLCIAIWLLLTYSLFSSQGYYGQFHQDKYLSEFVFKFKKNGFFVDIGAYDGITDSNSYYFEKNLGWTGICIEPQPDKFNLLKNNRKCECINGCIYKKNGEMDFLVVYGPAALLSGLMCTYDKKHLERIDNYLSQLGGKKEIIKIKTYNFNRLCKKYKIKKIDLLCIDTEGSEEEIIKSIDFDNIDIDVLVVENNYNDKKISNFLRSKNYRYLTRMCIDDIYKKVRNPKEWNYNMFEF